MKLYNEIDLLVGELLTERGVDYSAQYLGAFSGEWDHDKWLVNFNGEVFEYKTGTGHRIKRNKRPTVPNKARICRVDNEKERKQLIYFEVVSDRDYLAVAPTAASVLYCLLLDGNACDTSFNYWCDEYGYSNDSMQAFKIYQSCCEIDEKLNKALSYETRNKLNALLEDY